MHSKGWEFSCPLNFIGGLPESLTPGLLVGKLLVGLGVTHGSLMPQPAKPLSRSALVMPPSPFVLSRNWKNSYTHTYIYRYYTYIGLYLSLYIYLHIERETLSLSLYTFIYIYIEREREIDIHIYAYVHIYIYIYTYTYIPIYIIMYIYIYIYIYVYTYVYIRTPRCSSSASWAASTRSPYCVIITIIMFQ